MSTTVTVNEQVVVFTGVAWSRAVQVTVVAPIANVEPDAGAQLTVGAGSQVSVAVGVTYVTIAPVALVQSTAMFAGQVTAGPVTSRTVTVNVHVVVFTGVA